MKYTPPVIASLLPNEVFVFGSNLAGIHGAGAAKDACIRFGARWGVGVGLSGQSYAIPTKNANLETLPLGDIAVFVEEFLGFASRNSKLTFLVTPIGCGLAGYEPKDIAPLFLDGSRGPTENVVLPESFYKCL